MRREPLEPFPKLKQALPDAMDTLDPSRFLLLLRYLRAEALTQEMRVEGIVTLVLVLMLAEMGLAGVAAYLYERITITFIVCLYDLVSCVIYAVVVLAAEVSLDRIMRNDADLVIKDWKYALKDLRSAAERIEGICSDNWVKCVKYFDRMADQLHDVSVYISRTEAPMLVYGLDVASLIAPLSTAFFVSIWGMVWRLDAVQQGLHHVEDALEHAFNSA